MASLRKLSTRADITPVSFINVYNFGDFKGDPEKLMAQFFDAHIYVANWMTATFMVSVPIDTLTKEMAQAFRVPYILEFKETKSRWIITWNLEESENYDRFGMEDGSGWMAHLAPIREELLQGDMRSLYIGWLASASEERMDDDDLEPLALDGLADLTPAQIALAEFIEANKDWLTGCGIGRPSFKSSDIQPQEMAAWIDALPPEKSKAVLLELLKGNGKQAERKLKKQFMAWQQALKGEQTELPRRTVSELRKNAEAGRKIRLEQKARKKRQREIKRQKEREAYLKKLSGDFPKAWKTVQKTVLRGSGLAYDETCGILIDMAEAYRLGGNQKEFRQKLKEFIADHSRRKALIKRLVKAGLWHEA